MAATMGAAWNYNAGPADDTTGNAKHVPYEDNPFGSSHAPQEKVGKPSSSIHKRPSAWDLQSDSETTRTRRASMRAGHGTAMRKPSRNALRDKRDRPQRPEGRVDDSAWIHRDKLAQIEIQEMEEAGIPVRLSRRSISADPETSRRTSRSMSRSGARRSDSLDRQNEIANDEDYTAAYPGGEEPHRPRASTLQAADDGDHDQGTDGQKDIEVPPPPEVPAEPPFQKQHVLRPSTSRIPISVPSPAGPPPDSPNGQRKRSGSGAWTNKWDEIAKEKGRSNSVSSNVLLDDAERERTPPSSSTNKASSTEESSPPKSRVPKKKVSPVGRKASGSTAARPGSSQQNKPGPRAPSAASKRPDSSSGHKKVPSSSYPESEAPWVTSMYKPDPRLPPDQQMLPTHAKRMMQEQWEKEGKTGTVYDREFNLLNDDEVPKRSSLPKLSLDHSNLDTSVPEPSPTKPLASPGLSPHVEAQSPGLVSDNAWPLTPKSDVRSENGSIRPGTSGGYRITPTLPSTPTIEKTVISPSLPVNPTLRVPELAEKDEAQPRKGCCCVIM